MVVTLAGMSMRVRALQPKNWNCLMSVTLGESVYLGFIDLAPP